MQSSERLLRSLLGAATLLGIVLLALPAQAEDPLSYDYYTIITGLGSDFGCDYDGNGLNYGMIGVSGYSDGTISKTGAIQIYYDDGRLSGDVVACDPHIQVYTMDARQSGSPQGLVNTAFSIKIPELCSTGDCQWSTPYTGALVDSNGNLDEDQAQFPVYSKRAIYVIGQPQTPSENVVQTHWYIYIEKEDAPDDVISITQYVRGYVGKPYFDITWQVHTDSSEGYEDLKFWYAVDTFTSGVDFGFGYCCDVTPIAGASGGNLFFQGLIALQRAYKEAEHTWGHVFYMMDTDTVPYYSSNPLDPNADDPAPLRELVDNGFILQWGCDPSNTDDVQIGCNDQDTIDISSDSDIYINVRWTFDDPIRASTYGTAQALLELNRDDKKTLFDVHFDPTDWRGFINAFQNPTKCNSDEDCTNPGETCLKQPGCVDTEIPCPRYCAVDVCSDDDDCLGRWCLFGFCVEKKWEIQPELVSSGNDDRVIFTFDPDGTRIDFTSANANALMAQLGVSTLEEAEDLIEWARGTLNWTSDPSKVIDRNDSMHVDLVTTNLLRTRYSAEEGREWTLGDITHARPIYVGQSPLSPELLQNDKVPGKPHYFDYVNSEEYQNREQVLIVASNDGMLHCFDAETGEELWAFIPWAVLPKLKELAKPYYEKLRTPMLDLTPTVRDAFDPTTNQWRTVIVLGMRGGGNYYYALDITGDHLVNPAYLWGFTDDDLGQTYARPALARVALDPGSGLEEQVVIFGSGYAPTQAEQLSKEGYIFLVNLFEAELVDGELRPKWATGSEATSKIKITPPGDPSGHYFNNVVTGAAVIDQDLDGYDDKAFVADLHGNVWRINFVPNSGTLFVNVSRLFNTGSPFSITVYNKRLGAGSEQEYTYEKVPRPISGMPVVTRAKQDENGNSFMGDARNDDKPLVLFGTGKFDSFYDSFDKFILNPDEDPENWQYYYQYIYGVVDRSELSDCQPGSCDLSGFEVVSDELQENTLESSDNYRLIDTPNNAPSCVDNDDGCKGWKIKLESEPENRGERVVTDASLVMDYLFLTTFIPNGQGTCDIRGVNNAGGGYLMVVDVKTGGNPTQPILDKDMNGIVNEDDKVGGSYIAGMRFTGGILSSPVVDAVSGSVYFKTGTDVMPTRVHIKPIGEFKGSKTILYRIKY